MMALDAPSATLIVADHTDLRLLPAPMTRAALAELSAPIRTAPPPEPPPTTSYLLPEIAPNALVHAVGVYEGKYAEGVRRGFRQHPQGTVDVLVGGPQPVILVLSAYEPVKWRVQATGATRVEQILVFGNGTQEVETALRSARVYTSPQSSTSGSLVVYERTSSGYTRLAKAVRELTGKDIATFQGSYAGDTFSIDARPAAMDRDAPAIRRYVDENGVVHFEDSRLPPRDAPAPR
jgi:hypothetical protein